MCLSAALSRTSKAGREYVAEALMLIAKTTNQTRTLWHRDGNGHIIGLEDGRQFCELDATKYMRKGEMLFHII